MSGAYARVHVDEIAGDHEQIGLGLAHPVEPFVELGLADVLTGVDVADLGDDVAVERLG